MIIGIDGASRRNGKPNCLAAGSAFIEYDDETTTIKATSLLGATNQVGEMLGLLVGLRVAVEKQEEDVYVITDSEFLYNAVTKDWVGNWAAKGWLTAGGDPVKNQPLWEEINGLLVQLQSELHMYHIKGHVISLGKVTAAKLLYSDPTGVSLRAALRDKFELDVVKKPEVAAHAQELFKRNHGFELDPAIFKKFVVINAVADYAAGTYADKVDSGSAAQ